MADATSTAAEKPKNPWLMYGGGSLGGLGLLGLVFGYFDAQFDAAEKRDEKTQDRLLSMERRISDLAHSQDRETRELEIRIEKLEEWKVQVPDGTGLDRWKGVHQEIMLGRWQRLNPDHKLPDISDLLDR